MKLFKEIIKDLKIVLRSWTSLSLLVLGPLFLILLVGFTLSNEVPHDIIIGVHSEDRDLTVDFLQNISALGEVKEYKIVDRCLDDLKQQRVHLCLDVKNNPFANISRQQGSYTKGVLVFYFDDSNKKMSKLLIPQVNDIIGQKTSELSVASTQTILDQIQEMVFYVNSKRDAVAALQIKLTDVHDQLLLRQEKLQNISDQFTPKYNQIKALQQEMRVQLERVNASQYDVKTQLAELQALLGNVTDMLYQETKDNTTALLADPFNITSFVVENNTITFFYRNASLAAYDLKSYDLDEKLLLYRTAFDLAFTQVHERSDILQSYYDVSYQEVLSLTHQVDDLIAQLDAVKQLLDDELAFNQEAVVEINKSLTEINSTVVALDDRLGGLAQLDPSLADVLINPLIKEYSPVNVFRNIEAVFPGLLVMITAFITLLFSNILMLSEINAEAYFRNSISPASSLLTPLGVFFATLILVLFQITILLIIAKLKFGMVFSGVLVQVYLFCVLLIFFFTLVGMSLAYLIRTQEISVLTTTFLALGFYLFSNIITPLEMMPRLASMIAALNPIVLAEKALRQLILYKISISETTILLLMSYLVVLFALVLYLNKRMHDNQ